MAVSNKLGWEGLGSRPEPGYVSISLLSNTLFCMSTIASVQKFAIGSSTSVSFMKIPKGGTKVDQKTFWGKGRHMYTEQHSKFEELKSPIRGEGTNQLSNWGNDATTSVHCSVHVCTWQPDKLRWHYSGFGAHCTEDDPI